MTDRQEHHHRHARLAEEIYVRDLKDDPGSADWILAVGISQDEIQAAMTASNNLCNVSDAVRHDGGHMRVYRHLMTPPISQDQFRLLCPEWKKSSEVKGGPLPQDTANKVTEHFERLISRDLVPWFREQRDPTRPEIERMVAAVSYLLASQRFQTLRRNALAAKQEAAVLDLLKGLGWTKVTSKLIDRRADLPAKTYMHKTRFATSTNPQEVDVACGLGNTVVLAAECKVTNDKTNSVKRINDVLKKAAAWRHHWGSFVKTGAVLQGVIAAKDVDRLLKADVQVFWSHALEEFEVWIQEHSNVAD